MQGAVRLCRRDASTAPDTAWGSWSRGFFEEMWDSSASTSSFQAEFVTRSHVITPQDESEWWYSALGFPSPLFQGFYYNCVHILFWLSFFCSIGYFFFSCLVCELLWGRDWIWIFSLPLTLSFPLFLLLSFSLHCLLFSAFTSVSLHEHPKFSLGPSYLFVVVVHVCLYCELHLEQPGHFQQ